MAYSSTTQLISFIWKFIRPQKWAFAFIFLVSFVWSVDTVIWPYLLRLIIDSLTFHELSRAGIFSVLKFPLTIGAVFWVLIEIGFRLQGMLLAKALPKLEADIRMEMFDHIQHHSPRYFNENLSGSLGNKIHDMTTHVNAILQQLLTLFIPASAACCLVLGIFFNLSSTFFAIVLFWFTLHFAICVYFTRRSEEHELAHGRSRSELLTKIIDSLTNNFATNLFFRFSYERSYIKKFQEAEQHKHFLAKRSVEQMRFWLNLVNFLIGGVVIFGLMFAFWQKNLLTTGEIAQIFNMTSSIIALMWLTSLSLPPFFQSIAIAKDALSVMKEPQEILDPPRAAPLIVNTGEIVFENVSFYYGNKLLFKNEDVRIRGGEKIGLVGHSGAGKSTFVNLILRFYNVNTGQILIDGQEISKVTLESLRKQVAMIPQDPILFDRSLEENIRYGRIDATTEEIIEAAHLAHCDKFIERLPEKYKTMVGERGMRLSGGERQRIAIARAFLANAPILILDEATSALDSVTEQYIQESLENLMKNRTILAIAHRLSTLAYMDRILVFDKGQVVEEGTHEDLLANEGYYASIWQTQAEGFFPYGNEYQSE